MSRKERNKLIRDICESIGYIEGFAIKLIDDKNDMDFLFFETILSLKSDFKKLMETDDEFYSSSRDKEGSKIEVSEKTLTIWSRQSRKSYEWEPESKKRLLEMRDNGANFYEIAEQLKRTPQACNAMYYNIKKNPLKKIE